MVQQHHSSGESYHSSNVHMHLILLTGLQTSLAVSPMTQLLTFVKTTRQLPTADDFTDVDVFLSGHVI